MSDARELDKQQTFPFNQNNFNRGMVKNAPHEDIPESSVALLRNAHAYPTEVRPRLAAPIFVEYNAQTRPPVLLDDDGDPRSGITATKTGNIITATANVFEDTDVSHYFVWPGDPDFHDEIQEYISATQVRVDTSGNRNLTGGCWIHARNNLNVFHYSEKEKIIQWGQDVYIADNLALTSFTKALCISLDKPSNAISDWGELDEYGVIANSNGLFHLDFNEGAPYIFKKNTPVPAVLITSLQRNNDSKYRFDYTYAMARLSGIGLRDRITSGVKIIQESGPCALNENTDPARDYGTRWTTKRIDSGTKTNGKLTGAEMAAANQTPTYWAALTGLAAGVVRITINDDTQNFIIDFGLTGAAITSMADVARAIQIVVRSYFIFFTCEYIDNQFVLTTGEDDGSEIGWGLAGIGAGYTDIATIMLIRNGDGGTIDNANVWAQPQTMGMLTVPKNPTSPTIPEQHWTHYKVDRSTDNGPNGVTPRIDLNSNQDLPPLKFTWVKDVRTCGAFYASRDEDGLVTASVGEFEEHDVGCSLEWEDGEIDTILEYISSTQVLVRIGEAYGSEPKIAACAIGGGDVMRASQTGSTVTRTHGDTFIASDVGHTIHWANGYYSVIIEYVDANTVIVNDDIDKAVQGLTLDPISRHFHDNVSDFTLRARQGENHVGLLTNRFYVNMPNANILG
ncbi:MAG TPA: hypothetical protein VMV80_04240, partial [Anaerolineales bacterium]|nr:hypothetical protein [Anaerolineales bacterium]